MFLLLTSQYQKILSNKELFPFPNSWGGPAFGERFSGVPRGLGAGHRGAGVLCQSMQVPCDDGDLLWHQHSNTWGSGGTARSRSLRTKGSWGGETRKWEMMMKHSRQSMRCHWNEETKTQRWDESGSLHGTRGNHNRLAVVPHCPGHDLMAEKWNVSTNAVACMARQWPSLTQESMNDTWKCLFYCFESLFFHMVQVS